MKADMLYRKLFSNKKPGKNDIKENKTGMSPPFPSQIVIVKDLTLIFSILSGDSCIPKSQVLGEFKAHHKNRSSKKSILENSLKAPARHVTHLSLFKKYESLLLKCEKSPTHPLYGIEKCDRQGRKRIIANFIDGLNTFENDTRKKIAKGEYIHQTHKGRNNLTNL